MQIQKVGGIVARHSVLYCARSDRKLYVCDRVQLIIVAHISGYYIADIIEYN